MVDIQDTFCDYEHIKDAHRSEDQRNERDWWCVVQHTKHVLFLVRHGKYDQIYLHEHIKYGFYLVKHMKHED